MIMLDYSDKRPIYEQVVDKFKELIYKGVLKKDEQMPSVRSLAVELSINPNTIQRAYGELERDGFIYAVKGRGNYVSDINGMLPKRQEDFYIEVDTLLEKMPELEISKERLISHITSYFIELDKARQKSGGENPEIKGHD